ncbi:MAG: universal stress protein [Desulfobacteraceae bacterium]|nr:universal stress protein [Desulfobacteraceae bacterium]
MDTETQGDLSRRDRERHLLAAVDESDNSRRAVMYLADFFSGARDVFITLLSILPEPEEDFFPSDEARLAWRDDKKRQMEAVLASYRNILLTAGFSAEQVTARLEIKACPSVADAILEEQARLRSCIVVVGRRGISHHQEFVFGSTSNKILHQAKNCAVLVVE